MQWLKESFHVDKPIIAMCHLQALPGDPGYNMAGGMSKVVEMALADLDYLQNGGVDAVMFSNEFSLPYRLVGSHCFDRSCGRHRSKLHPRNHERGLRQRFRAVEYQRR